MIKQKISERNTLKVVHSAKPLSTVDNITLLDIYKELIKLDEQITQLSESTCITSKKQ